MNIQQSINKTINTLGAFSHLNKNSTLSENNIRQTNFNTPDPNKRREMANIRARLNFTLRRKQIFEASLYPKESTIKDNETEIKGEE